MGNVSWDKVRAEYISNGLSMRKLALKYKIPFSTLQKRAAREKWGTDRRAARTIMVENAVRESSEAVAENAAIAARIKAKLLKKLEKEIDALPDSLGSETRNSVVEMSGGLAGNKKQREITKAYKLRDLTAAYKDLTGDMDLNTDGEQVRIIIDV